MPKRILSGTVVSDKSDKTIVVRVERKVKHPLYGKIIRRSKKYHAHDEGNACKIGQDVRIQETKPISKNKTWIVIDGDGGDPKPAKKETAKKAAPKKADTKKPAAKKDDKKVAKKEEAEPKAA